MNNPYLRILNRAKYWQNKLEECTAIAKIEGSAYYPDREFIKGCAEKTNRYLRHIKRLGRLALQIENKELKNERTCKTS